MLISHLTRLNKYNFPYSYVCNTEDMLSLPHCKDITESRFKFMLKRIP